MKAVVDPNTCTGCTLCTDICPEVFEMDGGVARAKKEPSSPQEEKTCREAAASCPVGAITIVD